MRRSPARFLAPIALVAFAFALYSVVQDTQKSPTNSNGSNATATPTAGSKKSSSKSKASKKRKTYTVKSGDTLSGIAEKTGVSLETLNKLNPDADTLSPGEKLRLR
ncbi:LysM peptidoglycan-binding domain-containing protein [Solirubrobacter soli]|uniref:LysM peptidoglycan-binding domain-containing protein n=1 Tax=Solirubrobacter soli TaxID=363832 RepID=UPI00040F7E68|nr:LysM domain-containing protein [Solirubrobacter soli]